MKPITYRSLFSDGRVRELDGYPTGVPGLVISQAHRDSDQTGFRVVHARSGSLVVSEIPSPEAALAAAYDLGSLSVDWTRSGTEMQDCVRDAAFRDLVHAIAARYDGATQTGRAVGEFVDNGVIV